MDRLRDGSQAEPVRPPKPATPRQHHPGLRDGADPVRRRRGGAPAREPWAALGHAVARPEEPGRAAGGHARPGARPLLLFSDLGFRRAWPGDRGAVGDLRAAAEAIVLVPLYVARWAMAQFAEQQQAHTATLRALCQAVETKDFYTRGHSERVSRGAGMIARQIGMRTDRAEAVRFAGMLHDVGKLGVPTKVLQKDGRLTEEEYAAIQLHPMRGLEIVKDIGFLNEALAGIMHHHERIDGRGYPMGFAGDEIPEFARIIAVADAFDSMTSTRAYRGDQSPTRSPSCGAALARSSTRRSWKPSSRRSAASGGSCRSPAEPARSRDHDLPGSRRPDGPAASRGAAVTGRATSRWPGDGRVRRAALGGLADGRHRPAALLVLSGMLVVVSIAVTAARLRTSTPRRRGRLRSLHRVRRAPEARPARRQGGSADRHVGALSYAHAAEVGARDGPGHLRARDAGRARRGHRDDRRAHCRTSLRDGGPG